MAHNRIPKKKHKALDTFKQQEEFQLKRSCVKNYGKYILMGKKPSKM
jgi:hypothetical protein